MEHTEGISLEGPPQRLEKQYSRIFTKSAKQFLREFITEFDTKVDSLLLARERRRIDITSGNWKPEFRKIDEKDWTITEIPHRIRNRKLDLGDVSPANTINFTDALYADVQGIQVDFDDGHCPTFRNTITGIYNVTMAVHSMLPNGPSNIEKAPILWLRPRAFNMIEHHCMINGKEVSGPLFDFALLMFHNAKRMHDLKIGPYFYLSKIEDPVESALWNEIFVWTQRRLSIPERSIKSIILIENILAVYSMEPILYSIRDHIIGLNCGIWDYSASIISKFGNSPYMRLLIATCHKHGALATGGMAAKVLPAGKENAVNNRVNEIINQVYDAKKAEIEMGVDGFMVHDLRLVVHMNKLWSETCGSSDNQLKMVPNISDISERTLLEIPKGGVTIDGLKHNISVALLFIYHWLSGMGVFYFEGAVEDSATAEISRSQLWQWIRFNTPIEDSVGEHDKFVTRHLVYKHLDDIIISLRKTLGCTTSDAKRLISSKYILLEIISSRNYIEYITTFLNDNHKFRALHNKNDGLESKL
ncbi:malate synthase-like isoform X3 [Sitodiplosis mosellana]|uniref:malate synthase-like isoform X3 n=1 Tax=Sitodiplosis mosellana TaxID=263140 RepID=UPI0024448512|nr:malate synthase-like isoform X3 [Sitodiplosis mosellana]